METIWRAPKPPIVPWPPYDAPRASPHRYRPGRAAKRIALAAWGSETGFIKT